MLCRVEILGCIVQSHGRQGVTRVLDVDAALAGNLLDFLFQNILDEIKRIAGVLFFGLESIGDVGLSAKSFFDIYLHLLII